MKESLAYQIFTSIMAADEDWLQQSPRPSTSQEDDEFDFSNSIITDDRLTIFYGADDNENENAQLSATDFSRTDAVMLAEASIGLEPSSIDMESSLNLGSTIDVESSVDTESSVQSVLDVESTLDFEGCDVFDVSVGGVKEELKSRIKAKRLASGQEDLTVEFTRPDPEMLTEEEEQRREERREKNRLAAQKCRNKKRERADDLEIDVQKLNRRQTILKSEIQKLKDEKEHLEEIINVHHMVCPKIRKLSKS